jgi:hypothetical protein
MGHPQIYRSDVGHPPPGLNILCMIWNAATDQINNKTIATTVLGSIGITQYTEIIHKGPRMGLEAIRSAT